MAHDRCSLRTFELWRIWGRCVSHESNRAAGAWDHLHPPDFQGMARCSHSPHAHREHHHHAQAQNHWIPVAYATSPPVPMRSGIHQMLGTVRKLWMTFFAIIFWLSSMCNAFAFRTLVIVGEEAMRTSHSLLVRDLMSAGHHVDVVVAGVSSTFTLNAAYENVVIMAPEVEELSSTVDASAVAEFVQSGGNVAIAGDHFVSDIMQGVLSEFGMSWAGQDTAAIDHFRHDENDPEGDHTSILVSCVDEQRLQLTPAPYDVGPVIFRGTAVLPSASGSKGNTRSIHGLLCMHATTYVSCKRSHTQMYVYACCVRVSRANAFAKYIFAMCAHVFHARISCNRSPVRLPVRSPMGLPTGLPMGSVQYSGVVLNCCYASSPFSDDKVLSLMHSHACTHTD